MPLLPHWSKKTDELVRHVASLCSPTLRSELGRWIEGSPRFGAFMTMNRDKVRKKFTNAQDAEARLDVRAELLVAFLVLADRRFELAFEAYGARQLGPDLTVTYRANQRFNLEVTRLRTPGVDVARLATVVSGKVRQLAADLPNALIIGGRDLQITPDSLGAAEKLLKSHTNDRDDAFFAGRGLKNARDFHAHYLQLAGVFVLDEATRPPGTVWYANRDARRPLPADALPRLTACFRSAA